MGRRLMIGIFDSGIGGLTVLRALHVALPKAPLLYLADFGYSPYGDRSEQDILNRSHTILHWMKKRGVSLVVVACHTSSAVLTPALIAACGLPVVTMLQPTLNGILHHPQRQHWTKGIAILATALSIQKGTLMAALRDHGFHLPIHPIACPELAPLIESCQWERALAYVEGQTLSWFKTTPVDALVYGCTHYPLIEPWVQELALHGAYAPRIDPAHAVVSLVQQMLSPMSTMASVPLAPASSVHFLSFYYTGTPDQGQQRLAHHWPAVTSCMHTDLSMV